MLLITSSKIEKIINQKLLIFYKSDSSKFHLTIYKDFGFGMNWDGIILDGRNERYVIQQISG